MHWIRSSLISPFFSGGYMFRILPQACAILIFAAFASAAPDGLYVFLDLGPYTNMKRDDNFGSGRDGNDLKSVGKKGPRTLGGVNFKLDDGVIQLNSQFLAQQKPTKVEGIKVEHICK